MILIWQVDRRLQEMEKIIVETFESVIMMEIYPKSEIQIVVHIIESDGFVPFLPLFHVTSLLPLVPSSAQLSMLLRWRCWMLGSR